MNYMKRLERLWKLQEKLGKTLTDMEFGSEEANVVVDKIMRLRKMTARA